MILTRVKEAYPDTPPNSRESTFGYVSNVIPRPSRFEAWGPLYLNASSILSAFSFTGEYGEYTELTVTTGQMFIVLETSLEINELIKNETRGRQRTNSML